MTITDVQTSDYDDGIVAGTLLLDGSRVKFSLLTERDDENLRVYIVHACGYFPFPIGVLDEADLLDAIELEACTDDFQPGTMEV